MSLENNMQENIEMTEVQRNNDNQEDVKQEKIRLIGKAFILESDTPASWLAKIGVENEKNVAVINASNESVSFGGTGINGAIASLHRRVFPFENYWVNLCDSQNNPVHKKPLNLQNGTLTKSNSGILGGVPRRKDYRKNDYGIDTGEFAISDFPWTRKGGYIYHAAGPMNGDVADILYNLVFSMLSYAHTNGVDVIVLPAISTATFAHTLRMVQEAYDGLSRGVNDFYANNPNTMLQTILNAWTCDLDIEGDKIIVKGNYAFGQF